MLPETQKKDLGLKKGIHFKILSFENKVDGALFYFTGKLMQI